MASEQTIKDALEAYLGERKEQSDQLIISTDFETGNVRAKIRHGKENWFLVIVEEVYDDLTGDPNAVKTFLERMNAFARMKNTNRERAFWINLDEEGKLLGRYEPLDANAKPMSQPRIK